MRYYSEYYSNLSNKLIEYENIMVIGVIAGGALISGLSLSIILFRIINIINY